MKQEVTMSQAKILIYLSVVHNTRKYVSAIDAKVGNNYSYTMAVLQRMVNLGWLKKHRYGRRMFYDLSPTAPLEQAKKVFFDAELQQDLQDNYTQAELPEITAKEVSDAEDEIRE